jgi:RNA polymerase-binding transcription factor DksA
VIWCNKEQNGINNRDAATKKQIASTTDMAQQATERNQRQRFRNKEQKQINNKHTATTKKRESTSEMAQQ